MTGCVQGAKEFGVAAGGFGLLPADTADRAEEAGEGVTLILKKFPAALGPKWAAVTQSRRHCCFLISHLYFPNATK